MWGSLQQLRALFLRGSLALMFCMGALPASIDAHAQGIPRSDEQNAAELIRLIEQLQNSDDPDEQIVTLEATLELEPKLGQWPLRVSREVAKGGLLTALGDNYQKS